MNLTTTMLAVYEPMPQWLNFLAMGVALILGVLGVLIWAIMFRKKRRRKQHKRRERRGERKANPTLAESGGLPPPRSSAKTPDQSPLA